MVATFMAAKNGILIKGGNVLQTVKDIDTIVFDKTGTLTDGKPKVVDSIILDENDDDNDNDNDNDDSRTKSDNRACLLLKVLKACEHNSEHPIARAVESYC